MTLENLLKLNASRQNIDQIIEMVSGSKELLNELWSIFISLKEPESRRAAWAIDLMVESRQLVMNDSQIIKIIENLQLLKHDGLKRHSLRIIDNNKLLPETTGLLALNCFNWLESPCESVAVKLYSIRILTKISDIETELKRELIDLIEIQMDEATPGLKNIGLKTIMQLRKSIQKKSFQ